MDSLIYIGGTPAYQEGKGFETAELPMREMNPLAATISSPDARFSPEQAAFTRVCRTQLQKPLQGFRWSGPQQ